MNQKEYFILACKLFGIYCLLVALDYFFSNFQRYFIPYHYSDDLYHAILISRISGIGTVVIYVILGLYLLKNGRHLHSFAFKDQTIENPINFKSIFSLSLKLFGLFLIIDSLPHVLEVIFNYIYYTNVPKYLDTTDSQRIVYIKTIPTFITFFLGFYLLKTNNYLFKIGSKAIEK